jgi:dipeptidase E
MNLLLLSNSTNHGRQYLEHATDTVAAFLEGIDELLFIPYAGSDHSSYTELVAQSLKRIGISVRGLHTAPDPFAAIKDAQAIFTGGGNTFRLVKALHQLQLIEPIQQAIQSGTRYMGASAGTNIASPTLRTTNDMPIVEPGSFNTLNLVPFQINPHYLDADPESRHAGETRETRLTEFLEDNDVPVLGLREGTYLLVRKALHGAVRATVGGVPVSPDATAPGILFKRNNQPQNITGDVTRLLNAPANFDSPA